MKSEQMMSFKVKNTHCYCWSCLQVDNGEVRQFFHLHILIIRKKESAISIKVKWKLKCGSF